MTLEAKVKDFKSKESKGLDPKVKTKTSRTSSKCALKCYLTSTLQNNTAYCNFNGL